jgi:hypothetical protein
VDHAVACIALRPDQQKQVLAGGICVHVADEVLSRGDRLAIDFEDDVSGCETSIFCRARGADALDGYAVNLRRNAELLPRILIEVSYGETELAALRGRRVIVAGDLAVLVERAYLEVHRLCVAIADDAKSDGVARSDSADSNLEAASIDNLLTIKLNDNVTALQACTAGRRIGRDLRNDRTVGVRQMEEAGVVGCDVVHADAKVAVLRAAGLDDGFSSCTHDLRGDGEASACEGAAVGDDEGVDAYELTVCVDESAPPELPGLIAASVWM